jgi:proline racemase
MAVLHAKGQLGLNEDFVHEGILGTTFTGRLVGSTTVGPHPAVVPTITGSAYVYAISNYLLDPMDPFPEGFTVGDIWSVTGTT